MPKESLKDKLDGNELDLSLSSLETIPVNELLALPKATHLDLSCNLLKQIPNDFTSLRHVVKLDLSKNQLTELPQNIGLLNKLKYLDLYQNQLRTLPVSLFHLKYLEWLDVKDNPLEEPIKSIAGDCLDAKQCKACAKKVVQFMKEVQAEQERKLQKELEVKRALEAEKKAEEEKAKQLVREERKREKEKRRKEHEAKKAQQLLEERLEREKQRESEEEAHTGVTTTEVKKKEKGGLSCCGVLFAIVLGVVAVVLGLYYFCASHTDDEACRIANATITKYWTRAQTLLKQYYT